MLGETHTRPARPRPCIIHATIAARARSEVSPHYEHQQQASQPASQQTNKPNARIASSSARARACECVAGTENGSCRSGARAHACLNMRKLLICAHTHTHEYYSHGESQAEERQIASDLRAHSLVVFCVCVLSGGIGAMCAHVRTGAGVVHFTPLRRTRSRRHTSHTHTHTQWTNTFYNYATTTAHAQIRYGHMQ